MAEHLEGFQQYLISQKALSNNTIQFYLKDLQHYIQYLWDCSIDQPEQATPQVIRDYIVYLEEKGRSASTVTRNIASIRCYYQYLCQKEGCSYNPAQEIKREKIKRKLPNILTSEELDLLLSQPRISEAKGCRDRAMMELLYATGIRVSELTALNIGDLNFQEKVLLCRGGKNDRKIPVYPTAVEAVSDYLLRFRGNPGEAEGQALFVNLNGQRISRQGFWKIIKSYASQANITKEITPHTLRHSFALHLLENGAQLRDIQVMMGHADISSTQLYVQILDQFYQESYHYYHPKAKKDR
ncbi:MAG: tyrosine recombinase [Clostridium sp.]